MDRRSQNRVRVDLLINRFLNGHPYMCRMTDISSTGMRLVPLLEPAGVHRYMGLQFQLPGHERVFTAAGEAVNGAGDGDGGRGPRERGYGVRFTSLSAEGAAAIRALLAAA